MSPNIFPGKFCYCFGINYNIFDQKQCKQIVSRNTGQVIKINEKLTCESRNLIYRIKCKKCGKEYIGETGRTAKERIENHLTYIRTNKDQPTGVHFNKKGHGIEYFSWAAFEKINHQNPFYRKEQEKFRIQQFDIIEPNGLNRE